jgi:tetratricopeptide (TPR) repeat protein
LQNIASDSQSPPAPSALLGEAQRLIETGRLPAARRKTLELLAQQPDLAEGWLLLALAEQRLQRHEAMLAAAREAVRLQPDNVQAAQKLIEALLLCGHGAEARSRLAQLEQRAQQDAALLTALAGLYTQAGAHAERLRCAQRALPLAPGDPVRLASVAAAETACGLIAEAEQHLDELLERNPQDFGGYYRRSILRRQSPVRNHVEPMTRLLARLPVDAAEIVPLCYALAKECEDLERFAESFAYLQRGAARRRRGLSYQVSGDVAAMGAIVGTFDAHRLAQVGSVGTKDDAPIFIMGLPRSGTTLVDRILSSHSQVQSLGEINDLSYALVAQAQRAEDANTGPPDRLELIRRSAQLDFGALGSSYLRRVAEYPRDKPRCIDKTPWNFLYLGLIALALPKARIIHMRRAPMDGCFALYKTLFRAGSPYSYDLSDLARYYLAYHKLMEHWRRVLPGRFMDFDYEHLVQSQQSATRELLDGCGLPFEPQCLEFDRNRAPAATASAAQVREPIHARSIGLWKHYATQLAPLAAALREGGVAVEGGGG